MKVISIPLKIYKNIYVELTLKNTIKGFLTNGYFDKCPLFSNTDKQKK